MSKTHCLSRTKTYNIWAGIRKRCYCETAHNYHRYGGRGILMCKAWEKDFLAFLRDMGERPNGMSIERIDNNKGYSPSNCRWIPMTEQAVNRRNNLFVNAGKETLSQYARRMGVNYKSLHHYHRMMNAPLEEAVKMASVVPMKKGQWSTKKKWFTKPATNI